MCIGIQLVRIKKIAPNFRVNRPKFSSLVLAGRVSSTTSSRPSNGFNHLETYTYDESLSPDDSIAFGDNFFKEGRGNSDSFAPTAQSRLTGTDTTAIKYEVRFLEKLVKEAGQMELPDKLRGHVRTPDDNASFEVVLARIDEEKDNNQASKEDRNSVWKTVERRRDRLPDGRVLPALPKG
ncbi:hypothetical protein AAG570_008646 [Ranatra chinensis]|uniref:Uncharacterized protein n=1 Tax=Ranatra chinensis TaxID=642074 RepID=A0ABD0Z8L5_9HEMI